MNIDDIIEKDRVASDCFVAIVEIPKGSKNKYEVDKTTGFLRLDRILYTSTHYPHNYGYIPLTYADDNDPLDVLILCSEPIIPMTLVDCKPIGVVSMLDSGSFDEKIIAVAVNDPFYAQYENVSDLPLHVFDEIRHFFQVYKSLEGKETFVSSIEGKFKAMEIIQKNMDRYKSFKLNKK